MYQEALGTILVVEDEADLRFILTAHLRSAGYEVVEVADGYAAIAAAVERVPDLVIMDVGLPKMDGFAATRALKGDERTAHVPVLMLTARSSTEDIVRGLEAGAQEYLAKPFDMTELLARVRTVHHLASAHKDLDRLNTELEVEVGIKTHRLQLLYNFMRDLHQTTDRGEILDLVVRAVEQVTEAQRVSLLLRDATGEYLTCERAIGIDPSVVKKIKVKSVEGIAGQVFSSGKTLAAMAYGENNDIGRKYNSDAFLSTPLVSTSIQGGPGIIGVLNVTNKPDDAPFANEEIDCVRSIADAAAIALDNMLRKEQLQESVSVLLRTVGHLAEYRDEETTQHLERVSVMAGILATELARLGPYADPNAEEFIDMLVQAAPLHDIGKVGIPDDILTKPGKLTDEEFMIMKTHADIGRRVLSKALDPTNPVPLLQMCIDIAHCHHERFDGTGYPRRLAADKIPLSARIIALVDAYDAITSERRYSKARSHEEAVGIIKSEAGRHFDPVIVDAFLRCHERFEPVRTKIDGEPQVVSTSA